MSKNMDEMLLLSCTNRLNPQANNLVTTAKKYGLQAYYHIHEFSRAFQRMGPELIDLMVTCTMVVKIVLHCSA
jgi:hypothetical protein